MVYDELMIKLNMACKILNSMLFYLLTISLNLELNLSNKSGGQLINNFVYYVFLILYVLVVQSFYAKKQVIIYYQ